MKTKISCDIATTTRVTTIEGNTSGASGVVENGGWRYYLDPGKCVVNDLHSFEK